MEVSTSCRKEHSGIPGTRLGYLGRIQRAGLSGSRELRTQEEEEGGEGERFLRRKRPKDRNIGS